VNRLATTPNTKTTGLKMNAEKRQVALVTGGTRGIGFGCAAHLAAAGFDLAVNGIREENAVAADLDRLRQAGSEVIYCRGDIAVSSDRKNMLARIDAYFGRLHVLVNNAGVAPLQRLDILETTEESYDRVIDINLRGAFFLTQAVANWMIDQTSGPGGLRGCIINISSISAAVASVNRGEYCIAKAGMGMMTKLFAARLGEHGIPVYEIRPGIIKTDMTSGVVDKYDRLFAEGLCIDARWGLPDDVGQAAAALATGTFPYATGQVVMVDGGLTIPRL
jgi:NAD(P)-dependent dehydrogenase (short-subunit alcohol dehydrogenase family)